jgi:hypothetical protein
MYCGWTCFVPSNIRNEASFNKLLNFQKAEEYAENNLLHFVFKQVTIISSHLDFSSCLVQPTKLQQKTNPDMLLGSLC